MIVGWSTCQASWRQRRNGAQNATEVMKGMVMECINSVEERSTLRMLEQLQSIPRCIASCSQNPGLARLFEQQRLPLPELP